MAIVAGMDVPEPLIALQCAVYAARQALTEHVRTNGPVRAWSDRTNAAGAALQQTRDRAEAALQQAVTRSGLERDHGRRALNHALRAAALSRMEARATSVPERAGSHGESGCARVRAAGLRQGQGAPGQT